MYNLFLHITSQIGYNGGRLEAWWNIMSKKSFWPDPGTELWDRILDQFSPRAGPSSMEHPHQDLSILKNSGSLIFLSCLIEKT